MCSSKEEHKKWHRVHKVFQCGLKSFILCKTESKRVYRNSTHTAYTCNDCSLHYKNARVSTLKKVYEHMVGTLTTSWLYATLEILNVAHVTLVTSGGTYWRVWVIVVGESQYNSLWHWLAPERRKCWCWHLLHPEVQDITIQLVKNIKVSTWAHYSMAF